MNAAPKHMHKIDISYAQDCGKNLIAAVLFCRNKKIQFCRTWVIFDTA